jgi:hypothetical protein
MVMSRPWMTAEKKIPPLTVLPTRSSLQAT